MSDEYRYPLSLKSLTVLPIRGAKPPGEAPSAEPVASADSQSPASAEPELTFLQRKEIEGKIIGVLREIYDPEIPINIYELGLIYDIDVHPDRTVKVTMTLTAPACPVAGTLPGEVERKVETVPEVKSADVVLVWEPPWSRDRMSEAALLTLGMF